MFSLAFAAFLAVFREGAELILFYYALLADTQTHTAMVWAGLVVGCVLLVVIYLLIRFLSIRLPMTLFLIGTSVLLSLMAISFVGAGVKRLQSGNIVSMTPVPGLTSVDILGIYPTLETLIPQAILLVLTVTGFALQLHRSRAARTTNAVPVG